MFTKLHHIAIICSNYEVSKRFYTEILGLMPIRETFRSESNSYKLDLAFNGNYLIELFHFPFPPKRSSFPESTGLRHLAFEVDDIDLTICQLEAKGVKVEPVRYDSTTGKRFTFFKDPDELPLEIYEGDSYLRDNCSYTRVTKVLR